MTKAYELTTEDIEYLRHGDRALKLRLYKPRGAGPFPAVVDVHGGAWGKGSLEECRGRDEALAQAGLLVAAIDFRDGNDGYPTALVLRILLQQPFVSVALYVGTERGPVFLVDEIDDHPPQLGRVLELVLRFVEDQRERSFFVAERFERVSIVIEELVAVAR